MIFAVSLHLFFMFYWQIIFNIHFYYSFKYTLRMGSKSS